MIGLNCATIMTATLEESVRAAGSAGFDVIELRIPHLDSYLEEHTIEELSGLLQSSGVKPLSINAIEVFNTHDDLQFRRILELVERFAGLADNLQCPFLILVPQPEDAPWNDVLPRTVGRLRQIVELLQKYQVKPLLEFIGFPEFPVRTLAQAVEVVSSVRDAKIGIVLDTFHHAISGASDLRLTEREVDCISLVHLDDLEAGVNPPNVTDGHRVLPGQGAGQLGVIIDSLRTLRYQGAYSVELFREDYWQMDPLAVAKMAYQAARSVLM